LAATEELGDDYVRLQIALETESPIFVNVAITAGLNRDDYFSPVISEPVTSSGVP